MLDKAHNSPPVKANHAPINIAGSDALPNASKSSTLSVNHTFKTITKITITLENNPLILITYSSVSTTFPPNGLHCCLHSDIRLCACLALSSTLVMRSV